MSPVSVATVKDWAQTIVLVGSVVVSCVVLIFKVGGYTTRVEEAITKATALGTQAVQENVNQQKTLDLLADAEARRQRAEERAADRREADEPRRGPTFNEWPSLRRKSPQ